MSRFYAGIGARRGVPEEIAQLMPKISCKLEKLGYTLRSGLAEGSDWFFSSGVEKSQQWLPWRSFNKHLQNLKPNFEYRVIGDDPEAAESLKFHPNYENLTDPVKLLMKRNYRQIRGLHEPDSLFVLCWTPSAARVGGTSHALKIADFYKIPVYNLGEPSIFERLSKFVNGG